MAHGDTIKVYNGTRATSPAYVPVLGEPCAVKQADGTYRLVIGDGATTLASLPYTNDNGLLFDVRSPLYGAKGDGTTNDGAAIRAAVAAATTAGGVTYLPQGTYMMGEDGTTFGLLNLPSGARLTGPGTIKAISGQRAGVRGVHCGNSDIRVSDITVDLNNAVPSGATHGVYCLNTSKIRIHNVTVKNSLKGGIMLDAGAGGLTDVRITGCDIFDGITTNGITFYSAATNVTIDGVLIQGCRIITGVQPIDSEPIDGHADNVRIIGNYLATGDNYAITMSGASATQQNSGWEVIGNHLVGAVYCVHVKDSAVTGNRINALGTSNHAVHAYFDSSDISFTANHVYTQAGSIGFALALSAGTRPTGWSIKGNHIWTAGSASVAVSLRGCGPVVVTGNILHGVNDTTGILVQTAGGTVESVIVTDNDIDGYASGIVATPASTNNINALVISGNSIRNTNGSPTATSGVTLSGTVAQLLNSLVTANLVDPVYPTPYTYGAALVRESGGIAPTYSGNGSPESVVTANIGSLFKRRDGSTNTALYRKETGTGNTGWVAAAAGGDFSTGLSTSVDSEIVLFSGTGGKTGKRASTTGLLKGTSGVLSAATAGTDYSGGTSALATGVVKSTTSTGALSIATGADIAALLTSQNDDYTTSSGSPFTWTKPAGAVRIRVVCIGAGSGGGSGRTGIAGGARCGGGGGAGGLRVEVWLNAADVGSTELVTVGAGGAGGTAISGATTDGNAGTAGGASAFGAAGVRWLQALGSSPGGGGGLATAGSSGTAGGPGGSAGPASLATGAAGTGANTATGRGTSWTAGAGGAGAGITTGNVDSAGGVGGPGATGTTTPAAGGTASSGTAGGAGAAAKANSRQAGDGGAGGGSNSTGTAGTGGAGGGPGGGGGGGGAALGTGPSGAGGAGADGAVYVTTYFS